MCVNSMYDVFCRDFEISMIYIYNIWILCIFFGFIYIFVLVLVRKMKKKENLIFIFKCLKL